MGLSCRICKHKFSVPLTLEEEPSQDFNITTTKCGHLFHQKCLEASLTHQKLSHAMHGTGPLRNVCPAFQCGTVIEFDDIIKLCVTPEELHNDWEEEEFESLDNRVTKQLQRLSVEKDQWKIKADNFQSENEILNDAMEEIKFECDEMRSFLHEAEMIQKGDRVFWLNPDGSFSPAKIIELRQKSSRSMPYAVIKLERKKKSGSSGSTLQAERESFVVPANELLTFKSFFKEYFDEFSYKLKMIMSEMVVAKPGYLSSRKISKKRSSAGELSSTSFTSNFSISHEAIDKLIMERSNDPPPTTVSYEKSSQSSSKRAHYAISRRTTIHNGIGSGKTATIRSPIKVRSISQSYPQTLSFSDTTSGISFDSSAVGSVFQSPEDEATKDHLEHEYISEGERVIWYDTYCDHPQVGNVAALLQYTKCAIVKFDKLPSGPKQFEYRTVPVQQLFPYDLASPEEKFRIAVIYEFSLDEDTIDEDEETRANDYGGNEYEYKLDCNKNHEIIPDCDLENSIRPPSSLSTSNSEPEVEERTPYDAITATIFSMFYSTNVFERNLLDEDLSDDDKQKSVKQILTAEIIPSAKNTGDLPGNLVQDVLNLLGYGSEDYIQPQEFLVNMFEEVLKSKPFMTFVSGKEQSVLHLAIPEYHEESIMFAGENNQQQISYLDELFFMTLQTTGDKLTNIPSPALILNVNRPHFSHGSFIVPPVKLCLDQALNSVNIDEENLCSCNKIATWKCFTCVDTLKINVQGYCDDCRHIAADFHKDADHFPLLRCSQEGSYKKLKLHSVICKSKSNSYSSFIKCGMGHSDSWVLFQPAAKNNSKVVMLRSLESWLESLEPNSQELTNPDEIPAHVLKLLKEGSVFIYCPLSN